MFRKALTHIIIMTLAVLPVQLISAGVEKTGMQMSMMNSALMDIECEHGSDKKSSAMESGAVDADKSCCEDQSHHCQSCNHCAQAASSVMFLSFNQFAKSTPSLTQSYLTNYLVLSGIPQQNILKPPRAFI